MTGPDFVVKETARTMAGSLRTSDLRAIRSKLMAQGLVLLPGDTCYRLGSYAAYEESVEVLSSILSVKYSDIHLTAPNFESAIKWIDDSNFAATSLLEQLTPGPITVFCAPSSFAQDNSPSIRRLAADNSGKVGFRIPDSSIERDIASTNEHYLIASAPILHTETGEQIVEFQEALTNVEAQISRYGRAGWGAVEGRVCWSGPTSVVGVESTGAIHLLSEGVVPLEQIEACARLMPSTSFDDWG